jgi:hypothetical protein
MSFVRASTDPSMADGEALLVQECPVRPPELDAPISRAFGGHCHPAIRAEPGALIRAHAQRHVLVEAIVSIPAVRPESAGEVPP